jgi:hypothetical protein
VILLVLLEVWFFYGFGVTLDQSLVVNLFGCIIAPYCRSLNRLNSWLLVFFRPLCVCVCVCVCVCCFAVCLLFEFKVAKDGNKNESMCLSMSVLPIGEWI